MEWHPVPLLPLFVVRSEGLNCGLAVMLNNLCSLWEGGMAHGVVVLASSKHAAVLTDFVYTIGNLIIVGVGSYKKREKSTDLLLILF